MINNAYGHEFYKDRHRKTVYSAKTILSIVLEALPPVHSAVDFGCGVGTWLSVLRERGVSEILGLDGPWVERDLLEIPGRDFREANFEKVISTEKKYDLAITLEVAEHLPSIDAIHFFDSLVNSSDFVLFSAAIPFQGGAGHINEQWPDYWENVFSERGYVAIDLVRRRIWNDEQIPYWYRQNIILFAKKERVHDVKNPELNEHDMHSVDCLVHPETYLAVIRGMSSVRGSGKLLRKALLNYIKRKIKVKPKLD